MYRWPPEIPNLGNIVKKYIDEGKPLSISDDIGIYKELETKFAAMHNRKYALLCSSGTMALYSAYFTLNLKPGDEVICTAVSFHATVSPALFLGVKIVFCDVERDTGNIDVTAIEALINNKTKVIVTNDQWGHPCDKDSIVSLCKKYGLKYIEDCSHAHFARYKGKYVGSFGDIACWSFQGSKMLNGGEGGILLTDNFKLYERAVLFGHYSWRSINEVKSKEYLPINATGFGLKLRMHPLAAVIVMYELENCVENWIKSREETLLYFESQLTKYTPILPMKRKNYVDSMGAWYGFYPRIDTNKTNIDRKRLVSYCRDNNLEIKMPSNGILPYLPIFRRDENGNYHESVKKYLNAECYFDSIIGFPTFSNYEYEEIDRYVLLLQQYFHRYN